MRSIWDPHRREVARAIAAGQPLRVSPIGLDLVTCLHRYQRRRDDLAPDTERGELPVQDVPGGPRFVTGRKVLRRTELLDELSYRFRPVRDDTQRPHFAAPFRYRDGDRLGVDIEPDEP